MKLKLALSLFFCGTLLFAKAQRIEPDHEKVKGGELTIQPVMHASMVLTYQNKNIYVDPTGGAALYTGLAAPDMIIITDIHGDHLDPKTIDAVNTNHAIIVVPQAVADKLPATTDKSKLVILHNGDKSSQLRVSI